ncbi:MAG: hypothetical protein ACYC3I_08555 [Gemmataceae bacterium]
MQRKTEDSYVEVLAAKNGKGAAEERFLLCAIRYLCCELVFHEGYWKERLFAFSGKDRGFHMRLALLRTSGQTPASPPRKQGKLLLLLARRAGDNKFCPLVLNEPAPVFNASRFFNGMSNPLPVGWNPLSGSCRSH